MKEENILRDDNGNYAYLTLGGVLYTPNFLESIDKKLCEECGKCLEMCETRGLDEEGKIVPEFPEICSGCGHCVNACPSKGIIAKPLKYEEMLKRFRAWKKANGKLQE